MGSGPMRGPAWSPARRERRIRLAGASIDLAELYEAAVDLLGAPAAPARMLLLGHCIREVSNRLPNILRPDLPERSEQDKAVAALVGVWRTADVKIEASVDVTADAPISVPHHIAVQVEDLVTAFESGQGANYAKAAFLVTGSVPDDPSAVAKNPDPAVSDFLK